MVRPAPLPCCVPSEIFWSIFTARTTTKASFHADQQTHLLDSFSGAESLREQFAIARRTLLHLLDEKASILLDEQGAAREVDLLTHQAGEIEAADLQPGEEEILLSRQRVAANARRIGELCAQLAAGTSDDENSLTSKLEDLSRLTRELVRLDSSSSGIGQACEAVFEAANELARAVQSYSSALENESIDLAAIEARLDTIQSLKRKYGRTVEDVIAFGEQASRKLSDLLGRSERRGALDAEISAAEEEMRAHGEKLSAVRLSASQKLAEKVRAGLKVLGFTKSGFSVAAGESENPFRAWIRDGGISVFAESRRAIAGVAWDSIQRRNLPCHARSQERSCRSGRCSRPRF